MSDKPPIGTMLLRRLNTIQTAKLKGERDTKDRAIEFGRYLATAAEQFMAEQNRAWEAGETPDSEYWSALESAIYEFRKRADKCQIGEVQQ
jgi:hypothetical protein